MVFTDSHLPMSYPKSPYGENVLADFDFLFETDVESLLSNFNDTPSCNFTDLNLSCLLEDEKLNDLEGQLLDLNTDIHTFSFSLEWSHKKGKKKPQQFWVYCEEKQQSYARISLQSNKMTWTSASRIFLINGTNQLCLVQSYTPKVETQTAICLEYSQRLDQFIGYEKNVQTNQLLTVDRSKLEFQFMLENDDTQPIHPNQGSPGDINMKYQLGNIDCCDIWEPFQYTAVFSFTNRVEGWFKLKMQLLYCGVSLITSYSDLFMFNNPRLRKRKELSVYPSSTIKFVQCFALSRNGSEKEWYSSAIDLGYSIDKTIMNLGKLAFTPASKKRRLPVDFSSPPSKKQATQSLVKSISETPILL